MDYDVLWNEEDLLELEALNEILNIKQLKMFHVRHCKNREVKEHEIYNGIRRTSK